MSRLLGGKDISKCERYRGMSDIFDVDAAAIRLAQTLMMGGEALSGVR